MSTIDDELAKIRDRINQIKEEVQNKEIPPHHEAETVSTIGIDGEDLESMAEKIRDEINTNLRKNLDNAREGIRQNKERMRKEFFKNSMNMIPPLFPLISETQKLVGSVMENAMGIIEKAFEPLENLQINIEDLDYDDREKLMRIKAEAMAKIGEQLKKGFANLELKVDLDEFGDDRDDIVEDVLESIEDAIDDTVDQIDDTIDSVTDIVDEVTEEIEEIAEEIEEEQEIDVEWEDEEL